MVEKDNNNKNSFWWYLGIFLLSSIMVAIGLGNMIFLSKINSEIKDNTNCNLDINQNALKWYIGFNSVLFSLGIIAFVAVVIVLTINAVNSSKQAQNMASSANAYFNNKSLPGQGGQVQSPSDAAIAKAMSKPPPPIPMQK